MVPGQRRPELSTSNTFSPVSAHSEAGQGLKQTNSHSNQGDFNGLPVDPLEEVSKLKADGRMAGGAVGDGGRLHQEGVAADQEGSSTVCLCNHAPVQHLLWRGAVFGTFRVKRKGIFRFLTAMDLANR